MTEFSPPPMRAIKPFAAVGHQGLWWVELPDGSLSSHGD